MLPAFRNSFDRMETARFRILQLAEPLAEPRTRVSPGPGEWSVVQVVEHMVTIDRMVLKFVQKQLARPDLRPAGIATWMRAVLVTLALRYRKKIKAPAVLPPPTGSRSLAEWRDEWEASRRQWREMLEAVPEKLRHKE
ncbi:MAG TPA: DinB family protein, partial [Cytophagales bacterium]